MSQASTTRKRSSSMTALSTRVSAKKEILDMDTASKYGLMVLNMKATGRTTLLMEEASSTTSMEMSMMVSYPKVLTTIGNWENDKANGYGVYIHANGSKYEGDWRDDKQHGYGSEYWADGSQY
jgi:hypothetical protein